MVIPLPPMPDQIGPPTEFALQMRCPMATLLVVQSILVVCRWLPPLLDILGGFIMMIVVGFGWYAWSQDVNITYVCYWGGLCLIEGIFAIVKLIHQQVHSPYPLFSDKMSDLYNFGNGVLVAVPIFLLLGSVMAWFLYKDSRDGSGEIRPLNQPYRDDAQAGNFRFSRQSQTFQPFGGQGQTLGHA
mmetsp:Transcript_106105/g.167563  ORF Transcript_106105/g.167563 Transcript_106105/m.167563 type:complete len:186 (-) Transcript_106105:8-565(-)|eukprot:CAMPEP_0169204762 /NCGR_PEP_ID=MMETSP1016-20121227/12162_1 /TAXON_ID=342587 /ORGANISM="Karlodinium micrum, Strain CCMP2283" /LENGTH=185 /DNA_ID=CAMNT_0009281873 /DNA_START=112 /DNA_END=669 /DNA_ORIENTATION=+